MQNPIFMTLASFRLDYFSNEFTARVIERLFQLLKSLNETTEKEFQKIQSHPHHIIT